MHVAAIIAAGGMGTRVGGGQPKQFLDLGDGTMMVSRVLETVMNCPLVDEVVVALPAGDWRTADVDPGSKRLVWVTGGSRRQDSVANALAHVSDETDVIVIHDAARPFVTNALIERTIRAAAEHGAAIAAIPATDTVKQARRQGDGVRTVEDTLPRETIFLAQTPQAFRRDVLALAMAASGDTTVTDEAMLVERAGFPVRLVDGEFENAKVTTAEDFAAAGLAAGVRRSAIAMRIGTGYDLHRLADGRPLVLAGVCIPFERGLQGHSDADIVCHAVIDALLGAAAAGDIGRFFPDTDPNLKNADSIQLLRDACELIRNAGYAIVNIDVTVIAERPKLLPYIEGMCANLANALGIEPGAVSIKGKTNEGLGEVGRGEAMACHAVALITSDTRKHRNTEA